jgi:hypothetical protein
VKGSIDLFQIRYHIGSRRFEDSLVTEYINFGPFLGCPKDYSVRTIRGTISARTMTRAVSSSGGKWVQELFLSISVTSSIFLESGEGVEVSATASDERSRI